MAELYDIIAPAAPPPAPFPLAWALGGGALLLALAAGVYLWRRHRQRHRRRALRQLRRIERALACRAMDSREVAFGAAAALRRAYRLPRPTAAVHDGARWRQFIEALDQLRYRALPADAAQAAALLAETRHWIRLAPC